MQRSSVNHNADEDVISQAHLGVALLEGSFVDVGAAWPFHVDPTLARTPVDNSFARKVCRHGCSVTLASWSDSNGLVLMVVLLEKFVNAGGAVNCVVG